MRTFLWSAALLVLAVLLYAQDIMAPWSKPIEVSDSVPTNAAHMEIANPKGLSSNIVSTTSNNVVTFNGRVIGSIAGGTNFMPVPDVAALTASHEQGFALGVRYGAIATRRNPDVNDTATLVQIAGAILRADTELRSRNTK